MNKSLTRYQVWVVNTSSAALLYTWERWKTLLPALREGIIIALPRRIAKKNRSVIEPALKSLLQNIPGASLSTVTRFWTPWFRFVNEIGDMNHQELQKIVTQYPVS